MYKYKQATTTSLNINTSYEAERIEEKVNRILNNKEPITDGAPSIYTERKDGVLPDYNPRTDKWDHAIDTMDKVAQDKLEKRKERQTLAEKAKEGMDKESKTETKNETGGQSTQGTGNGTGDTK